MNNAADLSHIPYTPPKPPESLPEGVFLCSINSSEIKQIRNLSTLMIGYKVEWTEDPTLLECVGKRVTDFIKLEGPDFEIGKEKLNRLRHVTNKEDSQNSKDFLDEFVMITMKRSKKNDNFINIVYIATVPDNIGEAYNEYVAKCNEEIEAKSKPADYDPTVGF